MPKRKVKKAVETQEAEAEKVNAGQGVWNWEQGVEVKADRSSRKAEVDEEVVGAWDPWENGQQDAGGHDEPNIKDTKAFKWATSPDLLDATDLNDVLNEGVSIDDGQFGDMAPVEDKFDLWEAHPQKNLPYVLIVLHGSLC